MKMTWPLSTRRLCLRPVLATDIDAYARMWADPTVVRYLYHGVLDRAGSVDKLSERTGNGELAVGHWLNLAVELHGEVIGDVGLHLQEGPHRQAQVGYTFLRSVQGQGLATEAVGAVVDLAFASGHVHRVSGSLDARNARSAAVLSRLGFRHEATLVDNEFIKGEWTSEAIYAITAAEWIRAQGSPRPF